MFEQDYIMRLIKELVRTLLKLLFHIDIETPTAELLENMEEKYVLENLLELVDAGKINEAENQLIEMLSGGDRNKLEMALLFYAYLNEKTDEFLQENHFSRKEIKEGIEAAAARYGITNVSEIFLEDM